jgi:hypothetical protein
MQTGKTLREKKDQEIAMLITESNEAYSQRDTKKMKLVRLRAIEKEDVKNFEEKLKVLNQTIEAQRLTQNRTVEQRPTEQQTDGPTGSQSDQQEELTILSDQYHTTIQRTLELCGIPGLHELFAEAEKLERENFSLYNYVVEHGAARTRLQEEIDGLELQHQVLMAQVTSTDESQAGLLEKLTNDIQKVDAELKDAQDQKIANDAEFASAYVEIENIFKLFECKWDDAPDGKTTTTPLNSMFCLSAIETAIVNLMNAVFEKTKMECGYRDIKPSSFIPEQSEAQGQGLVTSKYTAITMVRTGEKEPGGKVAEAVRPMSVDELRALLD